MINPTKEIEITTTAYATQLNFKVFRYYNSDFHIIPVRLEKMYLNKYSTKRFFADTQPFKAVVY